MKQQNMIEIIVVISIHVATHLAASSFFFSHNFILKKLAAQSQNNKAHQRQIIVNGNTIFVAQFARYHIHLPIKIWSTILYNALTKNDIIHGIEKLSNSFDIFSFHKNASLFSIIHFKFKNLSCENICKLIIYSMVIIFIDCIFGFVF